MPVRLLTTPPRSKRGLRTALYRLHAGARRYGRWVHDNPAARLGPAPRCTSAASVDRGRARADAITICCRRPAAERSPRRLQLLSVSPESVDRGPRGRLRGGFTRRHSPLQEPWRSEEQRGKTRLILQDDPFSAGSPHRFSFPRHSYSMAVISSASAPPACARSLRPPPICRAALVRSEPRSARSGSHQSAPGPAAAPRRVRPPRTRCDLRARRCGPPRFGHRDGVRSDDTTREGRHENAARRGPLSGEERARGGEFS